MNSNKLLFLDEYIRSATIQNMIFLRFNQVCYYVMPLCTQPDSVLLLY
jgi:hypothetical protein